MTAPNYSRTRFACFFAYLAMASVFVLPAMLFTTFREAYNISFTLLGTLIVVNFCTQMIIDLIFTFFSKHFNIRLTVRIMPLLTCIGLLTYALVPNLFPQYAYLGLVIGTVIFSVSAGLSEVLLSPTIAAIYEVKSKQIKLVSKFWQHLLLLNFFELDNCSKYIHQAQGFHISTNEKMLLSSVFFSFQ